MHIQDEHIKYQSTNVLNLVIQSKNWSLVHTLHRKHSTNNQFPRGETKYMHIEQCAVECNHIRIHEYHRNAVCALQPD